ncbi:MAG: hypothetical protein JNK29_04080, partial [Anaerolineales bacterium]|nr:hypothetical protein [Anaerolineales bacterium]
WRALPAVGPDLFYNADVAANPAAFFSQVIFSMGCHAGLSVPDGAVGNALSSPDFAQVFAGAGAASFVANTGYGYGMDDSVYASEQLMLFYTQELGAAAGRSVGQALLDAKRRYFASLPAEGFGLYDEKALLEATLYGLPMQRVTVPSPRPVSNSALHPDFGAAQPAGQLTSIGLDLSLSPAATTSLTGTVYSFAGETQAFPGRPIQPRGGVAAPAPAGQLLRGALLTGAGYTDRPTFNPVIARPVTDVALPEPAYTAAGWTPGQFWAVNGLAGQPRVNVVGGQFNPAGPGGLPTERLYTDLALDLYYAPTASTDFAPPVVRDVNSQMAAAGGAAVFVNVEDVSGVQRVLATYNDAGAGRWRSVDLALDGAGVLWTGVLPVPVDTPFFVQALDTAGNSIYADSRGGYYRAGRSASDAINLVGVPHVFTATVQIDDGDGDAVVWEPVPLDVSGRLLISLGGIPATRSDCVLDAAGQCPIVITATVPGHVILGVQWSGDVTTQEGLAVNVDGRVDDIVKTYMAAGVQITPRSQTLEVNSPLTLTVHVTRDEGAGPEPAAGVTPTVTFSGPALTNGCAAGTDANGNCLVTVNAGQAGVYTLTAAVNVPAGPQSLPAVATAAVTYVDAQLTLTPGAAAAEVNQSVPVTAALSVNLGGGFGPAPDGTLITFTATGPLTPTTCATQAGACQVFLTSAQAGPLTTQATAAVLAGGVAVTRTASAAVTFVDARLVIGADGASAVGTSQTYTVVVTANAGNGYGFLPVAGLHPTVTVSPPATVLFNSCALTGTAGDGACAVTIQSNVAGAFLGQAAADIPVGGLSLYRATSQGAVKRFVDARLRFLPPLTAINGLDEPHTFTVLVEQNDGSGWQAAPNAPPVTVAFSLSANQANAYFTAGSTCLLVDGQCGVTINSTQAGSVTLNAQASLSVSGVPLTASTAGSDVTVTKTFVAGALSWSKVNDAGQPLGGAAFQVCRTADRFNTTLPSPECQLVADNDPLLDTDNRAGFLALANQKLGTYSVQEAAAPAGYSLDTVPRTVSASLEAPNGVIAAPFVNARLATGRLTPTQTTCQDYAAGTAADQTAVLYTVKNGVINSVAPGVFFYYSRVTAPAASFTISVQQTVSQAVAPPFAALFAVQNNNQVRLFNADCSVSAQLAGFTAGNGQAGLTVSGAAPGQVFIVSVKYDAGSVSGQAAPAPTPAPRYDFETRVNGAPADHDADGLALALK